MRTIDSADGLSCPIAQGRWRVRAWRLCVLAAGQVHFFGTNSDLPGVREMRALSPTTFV